MKQTLTFDCLHEYRGAKLNIPIHAHRRNSINATHKTIISRLKSFLKWLIAAAFADNIIVHRYNFFI